MQAVPADGQSLAEWFQEGVDAAVTTMQAVAPGEPRWTWAKPQGGETTDWYFRRIAQETLVHRMDAERAASGQVTEVDPDLAADGIAEMFEVFVPLVGNQPIGGKGETVHLHATDADSEWLVTLHADRVGGAPGHAKGRRRPSRDGSRSAAHGVGARSARHRGAPWRRVRDRHLHRGDEGLTQRGR
jgi:hypothetical protein